MTLNIFQELLQVIINVFLTSVWTAAWFAAVLITHYLILPFISSEGIFIHAVIIALSVILTNVSLEKIYGKQRFVRFHIFLSIFVAYLTEIIIYSATALSSATPLF